MLCAAKGMSSRGCGGCSTPPALPPPPPTHTYTHTFLKFVVFLTKCVYKTSRHNVIGTLGAFYHKKRNVGFYQYQVLLSLGLDIKLLPAMSHFEVM